MNIFKYILEINEVSYKWYLMIISSLITINFLVPNSLKNLNISPRLLLLFFIISSILKVYNKKHNVKNSVKLLTSITISKFQQILTHLGGLIIILLVVLKNNDILSLRSHLIEIGFSNYITLLLFGVLYIFILACVVNYDDSNNSSDTSIQLNISAEAIKLIYKNKKECIAEGRASTQHPLRRYAHFTEYESIIRLINIRNKNNLVLDNGCGDGTLAILMAKNGFNVIACDISEPNIEYAKARAVDGGVENKIKFLVADAENLPFSDNYFDCVVSSHVLEHLPDFYKGLKEVRRVTKKHAIIALPTCLNPCAWIILGGDSFWVISRWSFSAWFVGLGQVILNLGGIGVDGGYGGDERLPHIWRYPWTMRRDLKRGEFKIIHFEASSLCLPYFSFLLPVIKYLEKFKSKPIIRNFGYGSIAVVEK